MYALIYDDRHLNQLQKKVISVHAGRAESDKALSKRLNELGKKVWECHTRIVWTDKAVAAGDVLLSTDFITWRPDEDIPEGELNSDSD